MSLSLSLSLSLPFLRLFSLYLINYSYCAFFTHFVFLHSDGSRARVKSRGKSSRLL